jgi:microcystin-dependent protein
VDPAGCCQLAIGFSSSSNWLTGDSGKNITPGAGIRDCAGNLGTAGQALTSTGTALEWAGPFVPNACFIAKGSVVVGCAANSPYAIAAAPGDRYTLVSCSACPGGVDWSGVLSILGDYPVGATTFFAGQVAPLGWLIADGRAISRVSYGALFDVIGTTYGVGDGSTTFNLPDLRGMFTRGWDSAGGTARNCDPGRAFGSTQQDEVQAHNHDLRANSFDFSSGFATGRTVIGLACCQMTTGTKPNYTPYCFVCDPQVPTQSAVQCSTGTETRPVNVAMLPCIKYEVTNAPIYPTSGIPVNVMTAKGALLTASAPDSPVALPAGVKGSVLVPNPSAAIGLEWSGPGTNGQVLMACSTCANGTLWQTGAIGNWISAGTVQSVGFNSSGGGAVIPTTTLANNISYRQLGPKTYEVVGTLRYTVTTGGANGSGSSYILTLPAGLQFDTTLPYQTIFSGVFNDATFTNSYFLPGSSLTGSQDGAFMLLGGIIPLTATTYRIGIKTSTSLGAFDFWSTTYFELIRTGGTGRSWRFQFQVP